MPIRLPRDAHGYDYEDQICSLLLAHGFYLETRLILKKGAEEVLEFDAIATPVKDYQDRRVVEVKSGKWGIADIFKLYGQTMYTTEASAWLIHKRQAGETKKKAISEITERVPVSTIYFNLDDQEASDEIPTALEIPENIARTIFSTSWWSRSAERIAQSRFREWCRSQCELAEVVRNAQTYLVSIDECLFKRTPVTRVDALYDAYRAAPQITSSLIQHVAETSNESVRNVRRTVADNSGRPYLQYVMAQEYRARISIMKNAYDALLEEASSQKAGGNVFSWEDIIKTLLPESFKEGMEALRAYPHPEQVPFFYQIFVEVFGGFYCPEDKREITHIAGATGIPAADIPAALELVDKFFPIPNGWIHDGNRVRFLKGIPAYLRGAGCFARESLYGKDWAKQFPQLNWQIPNWHNSLYKLLEPSLKVEE